jgi:hypothetical protein
MQHSRISNEKPWKTPSTAAKTVELLTNKIHRNREAYTAKMFWFDQVTIFFLDNYFIIWYV